MTWHAGRRGWMGRPSKSALPAEVPGTQPTPAPAAPVVVPDVVRVPTFPCFSPAAIAALLRINRGTVHYYLGSGKLGFFRDNIGERYVLRAELLRFMVEYLQRKVRD